MTIMMMRPLYKLVIDLLINFIPHPQSTISSNMIEINFFSVKINFDSFLESDKLMCNWIKLLSIEKCFFNRKWKGERVVTQLLARATNWCQHKLNNYLIFPKLINFHVHTQEKFHWCISIMCSMMPTHAQNNDLLSFSLTRSRIISSIIMEKKEKF